MTKDSRRSSVAEPGPLFHHGNEEEGVVDIIAPAPRAMVDDLKKPSDVSGSDAQVAEQSQSLQVPNLTSANPSLNDGSASGNELGVAAAYGTRSRNRSGNARPNYAEDKEADAEFELPIAKENSGQKTTTMINQLDVSEPVIHASGSRKTTVHESESLPTKQNDSKDPIPGTSTFSTTQAPPSSSQSSKKRKAPAHPVAIPTQPPSHTNANSLATAQTADRRVSTAQVVPGFRETNMLGFDVCGGRLKKNKLVADDGTVLEVNDHVYLVCEPPGEPYYLGRIMEFLHLNNDNSQPIDALRLNWYYRPKDIGRQVNDTRQVFASMHSDISPLTALRGKCQIKHKSEAGKLEELRRAKDIFWYEKLYDRYIHRYYDVVPTNQVINVPVEVKKVLDERWKYIVVEPGRAKELTSAVKSCKKCNKYCASNDSVDCAVCQNTYHMSCVSPPLLKKPSRGFAWACGPCSKAQEKKLEARNTPNTSDPAFDADEELVEDEGESTGAVGTPVESEQTSSALLDAVEVSSNPGTPEQIHQLSLWLFRYLGIHCKVEDALDYDDRIYPRASTRLGPRYQANIAPWPGRPVEYVKPVEMKKKFLKGGGQKKDAKSCKDAAATLEAEKEARDKRPKWVMDEPPGYIARGEDYDNDDERNTARLLYRRPEASDIPSSGQNGLEFDESARDQLVLGYMARAGGLAGPLRLPEKSTNLLDVALETLHSHGFQTEKALQALVDMDRKVFKEPELTQAELKRFEDGVSKFGSEWHSIKKHVKTLKPKDVVRFYYTWKKTDRGRQVWGNYKGRKNKKEVKRAEATVGKLQDDVADEHDDSAFDNDKAFAKKRGFQCKFCTTRSSRQWRRAPATPAGAMISENPAYKVTGKDKGPQLMVALCRRCAELWRRYGIQWEDVDEVARKVAQAGGRAWKRKIDEELLKELVAANEVVNHAIHKAFTPVSSGVPSTPAVTLPATAEVVKKKGKALPDPMDIDPVADPGFVPVTQKKKVVVVPEKPPPPPVPEIPKPKTLPCAICRELEPLADQHLTCKECRISVHRNCYGVVGDNRGPGKWVCDMCSNDKNPQVSIQYKCVLCPIESTEHDFVEPPRITHKKKTEKERERERVEREDNLKAAEFYRKRQEEMNKPVNPREPLKRTANNNWVHVTCAVFTPEVKFGSAKALEPSEGIPSIASARYDETCKACKKKGGACVGCHVCRASVHVECAHQAGYVLGFDITSVKGSKRDLASTVNINGDVGLMMAAVWCKEHLPTKSVVHQMHEIIQETGLNALQLYVQNYKQADLTLTGTVRKATLINQSTKALVPLAVAQAVGRRISTANSNGATGRSNVKTEEATKAGQAADGKEHICATCNVHLTPRWWPFPYKVAETQVTPPLVESIEENGTHELPSIGLQSPSRSEEPGESNVALAAAALHQDPISLEILPTEVQCHQCHWKKIKKESPPPSPRPSPPPPNHQKDATPIPNLPLAISNSVGLSSENETANPPAHYVWPPAPSYVSTGPYSWQRPSPVLQGAPIHNHVNGIHSPQSRSNYIDNNYASRSSPPVQAYLRQPTPSIPQSPRQNGHIPQIPNGYPLSPQRMNSLGHLPNGTYSSFTSARPSTNHLTNGGPPPRAPDYSLPRLPSAYGPQPTSPPLSREPYHTGREMSLSSHPPSSMQPLHSEYPAMNLTRQHPPSGTHGSPPLMQDQRQQGRELYGAQNHDRSNDAQANGGGASESPSVRNLLS